MTENSASNPVAGESAVGANAAPETATAVGADKIDAYLDSVERVLLTANVAYSERVQILEDLALQITEMLNQQPLPHTEEIVQSVIHKLAPANHFASIYGTENQAPRASVAARSTKVPNNPWVVTAACGGATVVLSCLLLVLLAASRAGGPPVVAVMLLLFAGVFATPIAWRKGFAQLRAEPLRYRGRDVAIATMAAYVAVIPLLFLLLACALTDGYVLFPLAIASFIYFQYLLIRRLRQRVVAAIPTQPAAEPFKRPLWQFAQPAQTAPCT